MDKISLEPEEYRKLTREQRIDFLKSRIKEYSEVMREIKYMKGLIYETYKRK